MNRADQTSGGKIIDDCYDSQSRDDQFHGKENRILHTSAVPGSKVVADQRHDPLGKTKRYLHGDHIDLIGDPHGGYCIGAVYGGKVVENCHSGYI